MDLSLAPGTVSNGYLSFLTSCKINQENISSNRDCNVEARMILWWSSVSLFTASTEVDNGCRGKLNCSITIAPITRLPAAQCPVICFNAKCFTAPNLQTSKQSFILKQCQWSVLIPTAFYYKVQLPLDNRDPFIGQPFDLSIFWL